MNLEWYKKCQVSFSTGHYPGLPYGVFPQDITLHISKIKDFETPEKSERRAVSGER
jgi:hypothetical protein